MADKKCLSKKSLIIFICFFLIIALGFGLFTFKYLELSKEKDLLQSKYNKVASERNDLSSKNAVNESEINKLNQENSSLNEKVNSLDEKVNSLNKEFDSFKKKIVSQNVSSEKICYLTFDDGPSDNTLEILNILKSANAKATFFVAGTSKLSYIKLAKEQGHTIALHTDTHNFSQIYSNETEFLNDLESIHSKVTGFIGEISLIMRFPGGSSNLVSKQYNSGIMTRLSKMVEEKGYTYVDWNVNSGDADGHNVPPNTILSQIKRESKNKNQICVLMHDTDAKNTTVMALPSIISYLSSEGYRFEALTKDSQEFHHGIKN